MCQVVDHFAASDVQLLISTFIIGFSGGLDQPSSTALLVINPLGLVLGAGWGILVFATVRNDWAKMELPVIIVLPVTLVMPIFDIVIGKAATHSFPCSAQNLPVL